MTYYDEDAALEFVDSVYLPSTVLSVDHETLMPVACFDDLESTCLELAEAWGGEFCWRIGATLASLHVADELFMLAAGALPSKLE